MTRSTVTGELRTAQLSGTVHLPAGTPHAVLVCWPGGSYSRSYWDLMPGYSFAEHMADRGFLVVAADPLGVGASDKPADGDTVTMAAMAAAAASYVDGLRQRLRDGDPVLGGAPEVPVIGVGHSLGGGITVLEQAEHGSYDAIAVLGFTHGDKENALVGLEVEAGDDAAMQAAVAQAKAFFGDTWDDVYSSIDRTQNHGWLHAPDVPADVIAADDLLAVSWPRQSYVDALLAGHTAPFAGRVTCPVFVGFGEHDVPRTPHDDVAFYPASNDVTLYVVAGSAHCHNFSANRRQLWDRIADWAGTAVRH